MSTLSERLKLAIERADVSKSDLAKACGVKPASVSDWLSGKSKSMRAPVAQKAAEFLNVSIIWLSTGEGSPELGSNVSPARLKLKKIPLITFAQAGLLTDNGQIRDPNVCIDHGDYILVDEDMPDGTLGVIVEGDSMEPEFHEGDVVVIDPDLSPQPGDFVIAKRICPYSDSVESTFKKYRPRQYDENGNLEYELVPLNPDYPSLNSKRDKLSIVGIVVEHRRKFRRR